MNLDKDIQESLKSHSQEHLLKHWNGLSEEEKFAMKGDLDFLLSNIDVLEETIRDENKKEAELNLEPLGTDTLYKSESHGENERRWKDIGLKQIALGKVAAIVTAGGQGTRLGFDKPKGMFDLGLPSRKTLFQLLIEKIKKLESLSNSKIPIPLYIMTSDATHEDTLSYLEQKNYFGKPSEDVMLFKQGNMPVVDFAGKALLSSSCTVAKSPNGNGGFYNSLESDGVLGDMKRRGVEYVNLVFIDNALVRPADPLFVGFCVERKADCAVVAVPKIDESESVGVICKNNGKPIVAEYTEIGEKDRKMTNPDDGSLVFSSGNAGIHFYTVKFLESVVNSRLPIHIARKAVGHFSDGKLVVPTKPNAMKFEKFIFDTFPLSRSFAVLEVDRKECFAPAKNKQGRDSPETVRKLISDLHKRHIVAAGGKLMGQGDCEISPLLSYDGEGLESFVGGKTFNLPLNLEQ